jgi:hypothetical protein
VSYLESNSRRILSIPYCRDLRGIIEDAFSSPEKLESQVATFNVQRTVSHPDNHCLDERVFSILVAGFLGLAGGVAGEWCGVEMFLENTSWDRSSINLGTAKALLVALLVALRNQDSRHTLCASHWTQLVQDCLCRCPAAEDLGDSGLAIDAYDWICVALASSENHYKP